MFLLIVVLSCLYLGSQIIITLNRSSSNDSNLGHSLLQINFKNASGFESTDTLLVDQHTIGHPSDVPPSEKIIKANNQSFPTNSTRDPNVFNIENDHSHNDNDEKSIPHTLWFTYKENILETQTPVHLYQNVLKTIEKYTEAFKNQSENKEIRVNSLGDHECRDLVEKADPRLTQHFLDETEGMYKSDVCRVAALYLHGGYYFDIDMQVHTPFIATNNITFATAFDYPGVHFFQSFMASTPKNPILKEALEALLEYYEQRNPVCNKGQFCYIGTITLKQAYDRVVTERQEVPVENTLLLNEIKLETHVYPNFPRRPGVDDRLDWFCNYVVHDSTTQIVHFYSRIPGTKNCP